MEFRLKYNFFKRKNVENLNFMHSWLIWQLKYYVHREQKNEGDITASVTPIIR